ncbi:MAG TPA: DUF2935 domain-containing protein [Firmicutes bacterium]|nr:DUF2935 domain-containing protein [Bacillota bacterium]
MNRECYIVNREGSVKKKKQEKEKNEMLNLKEGSYEVPNAQASAEIIDNKKEVIQNGRLQEIRFWITIMKEHALFIKVSLPCDQTDLINEAQSFFELFKELEEEVQQAVIIDHCLLKAIIKAVKELIVFKRCVLRKMLECELRAAILPLFVDHITREAIHFLDIIVNPPAPKDPLRAIMIRSVFWLRIMKEHIEFIIHLLDPSERELLAQAEELLKVFRKLLETARDLESMSEANPRFFNAAVRFILEVNARTAALRDFKLLAHELVVLCRVLSTIPDPVLTDHVRREADKFLKELEEFKSMTNICESLTGTNGKKHYRLD